VREALGRLHSSRNSQNVDSECVIILRDQECISVELGGLQLNSYVRTVARGKGRSKESTTGYSLFGREICWARTRFESSTLASDSNGTSHSQGFSSSRMDLFRTRTDEASTILWGCKDRGPHSRLTNQRHPPESANVRQLEELVLQAVSGPWRRDKLANPEDNFTGEVVDRTAFW
jgi:hypothetical protein